MSSKKFDPNKLEKLNNPKRLQDISVDIIWNMLQKPGNDTLVEIGAGTAFFSIAFLKKSGAKKLYACDLSETMIEWMTNNVVPKYPEIIPVKTDKETVPLDDGLADLMFMINLHHELDSPESQLQESYRLLKHGGNVLIIDWKKEEMEEGPPIKIRCSSDEVREQLSLSGFHEVKIYDDLVKHFVVIGRKT